MSVDCRYCELALRGTMWASMGSSTRTFVAARSTIDDCDSSQRPAAERYDRVLLEILASSHEKVALCLCSYIYYMNLAFLSHYRYCYSDQNAADLDQLASAFDPYSAIALISLTI